MASTFPPGDHHLSFRKVQESFEAMGILMTTRNRTKGRAFGKEASAAAATPKCPTCTSLLSRICISW